MDTGGESQAPSVLKTMKKDDDGAVLYHQEQDFFNNYYHPHLRQTRKIS